MSNTQLETSGQYIISYTRQQLHQDSPFLQEPSVQKLTFLPVHSIEFAVWNRGVSNVLAEEICQGWFRTVWKLCQMN